ncbi:hypothetical protein MYCTH_97120 [Thermothelomyces thermophilus ATCC 42464]|uniref:Uncharacterized protein n=1 Tax=Thermothelomyces thermophilus (strain ATCC 42464 / BCRC 31852 / DSM 1799) TaxID=573729 RepID=G2QNQ7_THET4|nr:uncharacterized protein MYCTH_97120 [Thermothelomyces thermophilus ATCC 42464]AEO61281.1 hypothetical protein MYCTH_97120 [Thermothelomyces thermophilus ATCC 42464]
MAGGSRKSMTKRVLPQKPTLGIYVRVRVRSLWPKWMAGDGLWKEQNPGSLGTYCAAFPRDAPVVTNVRNTDQQGQDNGTRNPRSIDGPHRPTEKERICRYQEADYDRIDMLGARLGPGQWKRVSDRPRHPITARKGSDTADRVKSTGERMLEGDNARASTPPPGF